MQAAVALRLYHNVLGLFHNAQAGFAHKKATKQLPKKIFQLRRMVELVSTFSGRFGETPVYGSQRHRVKEIDNQGNLCLLHLAVAHATHYDFSEVVRGTNSDFRCWNWQMTITDTNTERDLG